MNFEQWLANWKADGHRKDSDLDINALRDAFDAGVTYGKNQATSDAYDAGWSQGQKDGYQEGVDSVDFDNPWHHS
jgi:hypothetical protein